MIKTKKRNIKFLDAKEVRRLLEKTSPTGYRGARDRALMEVLISTGMRIHEALALDRDEMILLCEDGGTSEFPIIGKGGRQRTIYFSPRSKVALRKWLTVRAKKDDSEERLFPMTIRAAQFMIARRAVDAGIDKRVTPHMFRHSFATDLLGRGVDLREVQEFLGHSSIMTTQIYLHVSSKKLKDTHSKLYS